MQPITNEIIQEFLSNNTIEYLPTHNKLSLAIINRIYKKMLFGIKFEAIKLNGRFVIDGHHRYISARIANISIETLNYPKSSATIEYCWEKVNFVEEEWDTKNKIQYLNELDAEYNNVSIEKIIEIIE